MPFREEAPASNPSPKADDKPAEGVAAEPAEKPASDATQPPKDEAAGTDEKVEAKPDAETDKRLSAIQKAEKHSREKLAKERAEMRAEMQLEFDRQRNALAPHMESLKAFEAAKANAHNDPVALFKALGIPVDQWDYAAQQLYNNSKAAESDPKRREYAAQAKEKRESESRLEAMQKRIDAMENEKKQQAQAAEQQKLEDQYYGDISKAIGEGHGRVQKTLDKNPARARTGILRTAERLFNATGELPDAEDVLAAYEAELDDLGVEPAAKKPAPPPVVDEKQKPSKTLDTAATGTKPAAPKGKPTREELIRDMPWDHGG